MKREDILKYKEFKKKETRITAGIVFIYNNRILLIHPPNEKWNKSFSYPKGHVDNKESIKSAAIRETEEEVGVKVPKQLLNKSNLYRIVNEDDKVIKVDYYYLIRLNDLSYNKYFKNDTVLKQKRLQKGEVDWAGFVSKRLSMEKIKPRLKRVLNHI